MAISHIAGQTLSSMSHILGITKATFSQIHGQTIGGGGGSVTFGAGTRGAVFGSDTTVTWSSPSVSGSNTVGIVMCYTEGSSTVTGITWNGSAMTEIAGAQDVGTAIRLQAFYIIAPAAGVTNVIITAGSTFTNLFAEAMYVTGAHQTTPIDASGVDQDLSGSNLNFVGTATTNNANELVLDQIIQDPQGSQIQTPDSPSTVVQNGNNGNQSWSTSRQSVASAGSPTMSWTSSGSTFDWRWNWVSIKPA